MSADSASGRLIRLLTIHSKKIYSLILCVDRPLSCGSEHSLDCELCGVHIIETTASLKTDLLRTCKQIAEEASQVLYTKNVFAIDCRPWSFYPSRMFPKPNNHILPASGYRFAKLVRHLEANFHLAKTLRLGSGSGLNAEPTSPQLDLKEVCKWYYGTLEPVCSEQPKTFPDLQSLTFTFRDHYAPWLRYKCDELFVLKVQMNRWTKQIHLFDPIIPLHAPPMPEVIWQFPENSRYDSEGYKNVMAKQDPKWLIFLPLRNLHNVIRIDVIQRWKERGTTTVKDGKTPELPYQRTWSFSSVDQFLAYAREGLSAFNRYPQDLTEYERV